MSTNVIDRLDAVFEAAEASGGVGHAELRFKPDEASAILERFSFERQRYADFRHIGMLADMMRNGEFVEGSQLTFCTNGGGRHVLIDGQHRLRASVMADMEMSWAIRALSGGGTPEGWYVLLDGQMKNRPASVVGRAVGFQNITGAMAASVIGAASIQNRWDTEYTLPPGCSKPPTRDNISRVHSRLGSFRVADGLLASAKGPIKRKLFSAQILAIFAETLAGAEDSAAAQAFWSATLQGRTELGLELRDKIIAGAPTKAPQTYMARLVASFWNQRESTKKARVFIRGPLAVDTTTLEIPS